MLVLSRREEEAIIIGDRIELVVVEIRGGKVKLGITAPEGVSVDREEVRRKKEVDNGMAE